MQSDAAAECVHTSAEPLSSAAPWRDEVADIPVSESGTAGDESHTKLKMKQA